MSTLEDEALSLLAGTHKSLSVPLLGLYQTAGGAEAGRIAVLYGPLFAAALLLLYCCFTAALLLLSGGAEAGRPHRGPIPLLGA